MARWSKDRNAAADTIAWSAEGSRQGGRGAANGSTWAWEAAAPQDPWGTLRREIDRARRYCRPLALMQIVPHGVALSPLPSDAPFRRPRRRRFRPGGLIDPGALQFLRECLRNGDELWTDRGRIFVMLPEGDLACAKGLVERLRLRAPQLTAAWEIRAATFPEHGFTAGALLAQLAAAGAVIDGRFAPVPLRPFPPRENADRRMADDTRLRAG
jgi:hypothetical protein